MAISVWHFPVLLQAEQQSAQLSLMCPLKSIVSKDDIKTTAELLRIKSGRCDLGQADLFLFCVCTKKKRIDLCLSGSFFTVSNLYHLIYEESYWAMS